MRFMGCRDFTFLKMSTTWWKMMHDFFSIPHISFDVSPLWFSALQLHWYITWLFEIWCSSSQNIHKWSMHAVRYNSRQIIEWNVICFPYSAIVAYVRNSWPTFLIFFLFLAKMCFHVIYLCTLNLCITINNTHRHECIVSTVHERL